MKRKKNNRILTKKTNYHQLRTLLYKQNPTVKRTCLSIATETYDFKSVITKDDKALNVDEA